MDEEYSSLYLRSLQYYAVCKYDLATNYHTQRPTWPLTRTLPYIIILRECVVVVRTWYNIIVTGVQVLYGDVQEAICHHAVYYSMWRKEQSHELRWLFLFLAAITASLVCFLLLYLYLYFHSYLSCQFLIEVCRTRVAIPYTGDFFAGYWLFLTNKPCVGSPSTLQVWTKNSITHFLYQIVEFKGACCCVYLYGIAWQRKLKSTVLKHDQTST